MKYLFNKGKGRNKAGVEAEVREWPLNWISLLMMFKHHFHVLPV